MSMFCRPPRMLDRLKYRVLAGGEMGKAFGGATSMAHVPDYRPLKAAVARQSQCAQ